MKLGFGLYRNMLNPNELRFAKQVGATHIVAHMPGIQTETGAALAAKYGKQAGHGYSAPDDPMWSYEGLRDLKAMVNAAGLELEALENFAPSQWYDILLDGPRKREQYEGLKRVIRDLGRVGIPVMGYYFSVAGVWGQELAPRARGEAVSVGFTGPEEPPIPRGMVWNMVYDAEAFDPDRSDDHLPSVSDEEIRQRFGEFLNELAPVAEEAGVRLALHPDDPPMPALRGAHRLSYTLERYERALQMHPSPANCLEMCLGTMAEMQGGGDIYATVDRVSAAGRIGYIHFRNVRGKVPHYEEVFVDEGDTDMLRILGILHRNGYDGVLIPDHTPLMECAAPWHAGMAYAMGYIRAAMTLIERGGRGFGNG
jgi:mannonate dehydratase